MGSLADTFNQSYRVRFYERDDPLRQLIAWLGDTPPTPSAGGGGYTAMTLPMRSAVSVWQGRGNLLVMDIPIMLWGGDQEPVVPIPPPRGTSGFLMAPGGGIYDIASPQTRAASTAQQADVLVKMWRPDDDTEPPPVIRVSAPQNVVPFQHLPYWISDFTWGAAIGDQSARRIMQQLVIQVTEYREDETLQTIKAKKGPKAKRQRFYTVKAGDTLTAIAARYHLPNGWRQLAAAQHPAITDPRSLRVGQRLLIPAK